LSSSKKDVAAQLDAVIPPFPRQLRVPICVKCSSARPRLIGTAFDYALRFELQLRNRCASDGAWVAEHALHLLAEDAHLAEAVAGFGTVRIGTNTGRLDDSGILVTPRFVQQARRVVDGARRFVRSHRGRPVRQSTRNIIAAHAVRLAKLDPYYRAGYPDPTLGKAGAREVREIVRLLSIVPFESLRHSSTMLLNPSFGRYSSLVRGADADLIVGERLIEIKATKKPHVERDMVRQLVGYMILAHRASRSDRSLPRLRSLEIYFARYGFTWSMPTAAILGSPDYPDVERWFIGRAKADGDSPRPGRRRAFG
jgi:hypothetical protein